MERFHKTAAPLTCGTCPYFDKKGGWCKVSATWRSRYTKRCSYGEMLEKQQHKKAKHKENT